MRNVVRLRGASLATVLGLAVFGCIAGEGSSSPTVSRPSTGSGGIPLPTAQPSVSPSAGLDGPVADEHIEAARADLAQRFGYEPETVLVDRVEAVTWRDAALGCPNHERSYDPTPVPGYRIALRVGTLDFQYHGAVGEAPFLCQFLD